MVTVASVLAEHIKSLAAWSDRQGRTNRLSELKEVANSMRKAGFLSDADFDYLQGLARESANV